jgi:hypothetical protein
MSSESRTSAIVGDRRNGDAALVHAAVDGNVRVAINDTGRRDEFAFGVDDGGVFGSFDGCADFGDFAVP